MANISHPDDIAQFLEILLQKMVKAGAITPAQKNDVKNVLAPALEQAGGLDPKDPNTVNQLKSGVVDALLVGRVAGKNSLSFQNIEPVKAAIGLVALNFKANLTAEDKRKYSMGMAYLLVMEKNPELKVSLKLALQDPKTLTPAERKQLAADLEKIMPLLNGIQTDRKLSAADLAEAIKLVKSELEKDPNAVKTPTENKQLMDSLTALFGMDPSTPGKITGPIQCMMGNALGIADNFPALGAEPIHGYSGDILNASMQSATGQYQLDVDRDEGLGEAFDVEPKDSSALESAPAKEDGPSASESLTSAFADMVEDAAKETFAPKAKEEAAHTKETNKEATKEQESPYKPRSPFDSIHGGPPKPGQT